MNQKTPFQKNGVFLSTCYTLRIMENSQTRGFVNIILIIVVVVLAGVLGYVALVKKSAPTEQQRPSSIEENTQSTLPATTVNTNIPTQVDETADWKTYTNAQYGFQISYPKNATISFPTAGAHGMDFVVYIEGVESSVQSKYSTSKMISITMVPLKGFDMTSGDSGINPSITSINGTQFAIFDWDYHSEASDSSPAGFLGRAYNTENINNGYGYRLYVRISGEASVFDVDEFKKGQLLVDKAILEKIISTFKFIPLAKS